MVLFRLGFRPFTAAASTAASAPTRPSISKLRAGGNGARVGAVGAGTVTAAAASLSLFSWGQNEDKTGSTHAGWISKSGFLAREASPAMAAIKKQAYTLVFLSSPNVDHNTDRNSRKRWGGLLGYFQESSGYDCLDLTAAAERKDSESGASAAKQGENEEFLVLADELHAQLRLAMLQRPPIIFASPPSSKILSAYIGPDTRATPLLSGAVITLDAPAAANYRSSSSSSLSEALSASALPTSSGTTASFKAPVLVVLPSSASSEHDVSALESRVRELWGPKAELLRVESSDAHSEEAVREIERWMLSRGF
ncbi:hypothetical protein A4X13_0g5974 [Tilletia indica]|uniref:Uncharacterized protein n=1 Tax=Tilletia indica TaxID=43049 RepID=A0A177TT65_9BASI|nr:hypothetical protein A4X13_0g5974 [Tilletia indica]